ncbi:FCD domain-containing protein [Anaerotignum sp.]|uniref:FCD domain-containing protein n=1 Tax=Anaerotignum sp. TaxID=2039241 RepID=UPI0037363A9D
MTDLNEKIINDLCTVVLIHLLGAFKICRDTGKMPVLIAKLRQAFEKQQSMYDTDNSNDYVAASMDFERSFIIAADNPMLEKTYDVVITILTLSITYDQISHRERNIEEHRKILEAIEENDVPKAEDLLSKHYNNRAEHSMCAETSVKA